MEMKFQAIFQLQTVFTTNIIPSKHFVSKKARKKLRLCRDG